MAVVTVKLRACSAPQATSEWVSCRCGWSVLCSNSWDAITLWDIHRSRPPRIATRID